MEGKIEYAVQVAGSRETTVIDTNGDARTFREAPWIKFGVGFSRGPESMNAQLTGGQVKTFIAIALRIDEETGCFPSTATIAEDSGQDESTVRRHLYGHKNVGGLVEFGLVEVAERPGDTNVYRIRRYAAYGKDNVPNQAPVTSTPGTHAGGTSGMGAPPPQAPVRPKEEPISRTSEVEPITPAAPAAGMAKKPVDVGAIMAQLYGSGDDRAEARMGEARELERVLQHQFGQRDKRISEGQLKRLLKPVTIGDPKTPASLRDLPCPADLYDTDPFFKEYVQEGIDWTQGDDFRSKTLAARRNACISWIRNYERVPNGWLARQRQRETVRELEEQEVDPYDRQFEEWLEKGKD